MTKQHKILLHLVKGYEVTQRTAIQLFDSYRLAHVVFKLIEKGYDIQNVQKERGEKHGIYKMPEDAIIKAKVRLGLVSEKDAK